MRRGGVQTLHTTKENLECLQRENALQELEEELPKTIGDTIFSVRRLGGKYL
ncbi:hypothetical protein K458DRAFT_422006 [Lentithecium fluviatile CBS 122367]|uniref:Uncharacterized protein n=1 Tax=Lentithecium fluviatile CBS 122367 TaxID=1168545 RepID=A0A6G1INY0_9PLEO|nr:hypothetical protein K458DRAFT_422006 [Lentithecium fluviatile CBS 122367]